MNRLTKRDAGGNPTMNCDVCDEKGRGHCGLLPCRNQLIKHLAAYEDTGLEPEEIHFCLDGAITPEEAKARAERNMKRYDEWFTWNRADEESRLLVLPCKVGDTVYQTDGVRVYELTVHRLIFDAGTVAFDESAIGKSIHITREGAEAAMRKEKSK